MTRPPRFRSYDEIAEVVGVELCGWTCWALGDQASRHGYGYVADDKVHWRRRGLKRRGIYRFLKLCARALLRTDVHPIAKRTWLEATWAYDMALQLGYRFPAEFADEDRALVRAHLARAGVATIEIRERMVRWSRGRD